MKRATLIACLCLAAPASPAVAQHHDSGSHAQHAAEPVNAMCPIGKEPIVPSAGTVEYKGKAIGLCCPGCGKQFLAWDEARKDEFVAMAVAGREPGMKHGDDAKSAGEATAQDGAQPGTDTYPLDTCPISGQKLGSMGDPVIKTIDGREVRFCCPGCIDRFEADKATYWQKIDKEIVKAQMPFYPLTTCPISGEELGGEMGDPVDYVYNNRLVRFCCKSCLSKFLENPKPTLAKLDEAVIAQQKLHYPLTTCVVSGETLGGEMGEPVERIYNNHLLRFCCKGCLKDFEKNPARFLGMLDEAWKKQGGPPKGVSGDHHDDHGRGTQAEHDADGHGHGAHGGGHHRGGGGGHH